jgi:predicted PurR-regulated permease PerM
VNGRRVGRHPLLPRVAQITLVVLAVVAVAAAAYTIRGILLLIGIGFLIAAGLDPLVSALTRRGMRRGLAVAAIIGGGVLSVGLFIVFAVTPAVTQFAEFATQLPDTLTHLTDRLTRGDTTIGRWLASPDVSQQVQKLLSRLPGMIASSVDAVFGAVSAVAGAVFATLTVTVLSIYFVLALPRIRRFLADWLGDDERTEVMNEVFNRVGGYVTGQLMVCLANGVASYIFFTIIGMPYAALLAVAVGLLDAVPQFGALLGGALGVIMALPQGLGVAIATLVFFVVYQQFENYFLAPRLFSRAVELTPLAVFVAVLIGGSLAGLGGAIAALPAAAALKVIMRYAFRDRLAAMGAAGASEPDDAAAGQPDDSAGHAGDATGVPTGGAAPDVAVTAPGSGPPTGEQTAPERAASRR